MEEIEKVTFRNTKRFVICRRMGVGNPEGPRRELVDETDLFSQAESLPALLAAERAMRAAGRPLRAPEASCYEALCARTGEIVARHDAGAAPAWALEVLGAAGPKAPAAA